MRAPPAHPGDGVHPRRTATGELRGKIAYASPERLLQQPVDRRADVFSLGAVLWESFALRPLFPRKDLAATMRAIQRGHVPPLRAARPDIPLDLDVLVSQALAVDPSRRFPTTRAMGDALLDVMASESCAVGASHVARWMDRLFRGAYERRSRRVNHALTLKAEAGPRLGTSLTPRAHTPIAGTTLRLLYPHLGVVAVVATLVGLGLGMLLGFWLAR